MSTKKKSSPDSIVREIKRKTRHRYSAEEKIRIVLEGLASRYRSPHQFWDAIPEWEKQRVV